jgi:hypothetical protein
MNEWLDGTYFVVDHAVTELRVAGTSRDALMRLPEIARLTGFPYKRLKQYARVLRAAAPDAGHGNYRLGDVLDLMAAKWQRKLHAEKLAALSPDEWRDRINERQRRYRLQNRLPAEDTWVRMERPASSLKPGDMLVNLQDRRVVKYPVCIDRACRDPYTRGNTVLWYVDLDTATRYSDVMPADTLCVVYRNEL